MILLVDDNLYPTKLYAAWLRDEGFETEVRHSVDEAWKLLETSAIEIKVIVLDIMMPAAERYLEQDQDGEYGGSSTGVFFFEELRRHHPYIRVVILTNVENPDILHKVSDGNRTRILKKSSCPPDILAAAVAEALSAPPSSSAPKAYPSPGSKCQL